MLLGDQAKFDGRSRQLPNLRLEFLREQDLIQEDIWVLELFVEISFKLGMDFARPSRSEFLARITIAAFALFPFLIASSAVLMSINLISLSSTSLRGSYSHWMALFWHTSKLAGYDNQGSEDQHRDPVARHSSPLTTFVLRSLFLLWQDVEPRLWTLFGSTTSKACVHGAC